jgi:hypothetical protein
VGSGAWSMCVVCSHIDRAWSRICPYCGRVQGVEDYDRTFHYSQCAVNVASLRTLARNLTIGAALCRAFRLGFDAGWGVTGEGFNSEYTGPKFTREKYERMASVSDPSELTGDDWRPGCGRAPRRDP